MTGTTAAATRRGARRIGVALVISLIFVVLAGWYWWRTTGNEASYMRDANSSAPVASTESIDNSGPGSQSPGPGASALGVPAGATTISGEEITAALSDHTALLPGGFVEYYAPDGTLHGRVEEKRYGGSWDVRNSTFCTVLQGSDARICSPVERKGNTLYWRLDGEQEASPVRTMSGNPANLK